MEVTPDLLSVFPLLRPLPPATLTRLASCSWVEKFSRRGIVLDPNKSEAVVCFLFEGKLQGIDFTVDGREVGLYFVDPGDFCGEAALFDDLARPEYVVSLAHSVAVKVPSVAIQEDLLDHICTLRLETPKQKNRSTL